ncbi:unnamed protein product [Moneuplotes crassus]|uniref:RBR-type E3 ubiquitin transferase n=1 Tax=Euplotes crassus TaxID=5936 RepID=A0AAD1X7N2_EUPCR|nr:unnamed protein product [Moneuplotes crassus]
MGKHQEPRRRYRDEEESQEEYVDDNQQEVQESEQESSEEPRPKRPKHSLLPSESEYESTDGNPENDCDWCKQDFYDPVTLPCEHQICRKCFQRVIHKRLKVRRIVRCLTCKEKAPLDYLKKYMKKKDRKLFKKVRDHIKVESNPKLHFCPIEGCPKVVEGIKGKKNTPKFVTCANGHSFCILCNQIKHKGKTCEEAKSKWSFYDNPKTRRCPHCKTIIQITKVVDAHDLECQVCGNKVPEQKRKHRSTLGNILTYVFLIFMTPFSAAKKVYKSTGLKDDLKPKDEYDDSDDEEEKNKEREERESKMPVKIPPGLKKAGKILLVVLTIVVMIFGGAVILAPCAYFMRIKSHMEETEEKLSFKNQFDLDSDEEESDSEYT